MTEAILSLRQDIYSILLSSSQQHADFWLVHFMDNIESMSSETEVLQRINLFWHIHLAKSQQDLFTVRNWLSDDISIEEWKKRFIAKVVPTIVKNIKT